MSSPGLYETEVIPRRDERARPGAERCGLDQSRWVGASRRWCGRAPGNPLQGAGASEGQLALGGGVSPPRGRHGAALSPGAPPSPPW
jgi:hypothetical protein